jgi:hypothetical protein
VLERIARRSLSSRGAWTPLFLCLHKELQQPATAKSGVRKLLRGVTDRTLWCVPGAYAIPWYWCVLHRPRAGLDSNPVSARVFDDQRRQATPIDVRGLVPHKRSVQSLEGASHTRRDVELQALG